MLGARKFHFRKHNKSISWENITKFFQGKIWGKGWKRRRTFFEKIQEIFSESVFFIFCAWKGSSWNIRSFLSLGVKNFISQNIRVPFFMKYKKNLFWKSIRKRTFFVFFVFGAWEVPSWNIRSFQSLGLVSSISRNIRKAFFWENVRKFFRVDYFLSLGWKVCQVALKSTTIKFSLKAMPRHRD